MTYPLDTPLDTILDDAVLADLVPADAGDCADGLARMLTRMVDPYIPGIHCGPGWYRLLVALDERLAALAPDYILGEVRSRAGFLSYYIDLPEVIPTCCQEFAARHPRLAYDNELAQNLWESLREVHLQDVEHQEGLAAAALRRQERAELRDALELIVWDTVQDAARICELCGQPGVIRTYAGETGVRCSSCSLD